MEIFPYNDGVRDRFGDPFRIERIMESYCAGSVAKALEQALSPNPQISNPANDQLMEAVCVAFEIQPFDPATGAGSNEGFQRALWEQFGDWKAKKKASTALPPNSPTLTAGGHPSGPGPFQQMPARPTFSMGSGSTSR